MTKRLIQLEGEPLFNLWSYARPGSSRRDRPSPEEIKQITLTIGRAPEVMVKVLTRGGQDLKGIRRHLSYLNRGGDLAIGTDDGEWLKGEGVESDLLSDWDLELEEDRRRSKLGPREDRAPPKMVHKFLFSMPPGTPPRKVLNAVQNFAREEFALQHRYALVLHTDEPHPHVHMVVKSVSEQGQRLNIRKATLRHWRSEFARHLREQGIAANATDRTTRGETKPRKLDSIHRAMLRGESTHMRRRLESTVSAVRTEDAPTDSRKIAVLKMRKDVERGWLAVSRALASAGQVELAEQVARFIDKMPPPRSESEWLAAEFLEHRRSPHVRA